MLEPTVKFVAGVMAPEVYATLPIEALFVTESAVPPPVRKSAVVPVAVVNVIPWRVDPPLATWSAVPALVSEMVVPVAFKKVVFARDDDVLTVSTEILEVVSVAWPRLSILVMPAIWSTPLLATFKLPFTVEVPAAKVPVPVAEVKVNPWMAALPAVI